MKNLYQTEDREELKSRLGQLTPDSPRLWGKMTPGQMLAHCAAGVEMGTGDLRIPRALIGRIIGPSIKKVIVRDDAPIRRNAPTAKELQIEVDPASFEADRARLTELIDRFAAAGPEGCTRHPHPFFGPLTPDEWAILIYKHLDHHLRQFSA